MANSTTRIIGRDPFLPSGKTPGCTGRNDAADPSVQACAAADTPGTLGCGGDAADPTSRLSPPPPAKKKLLILDFDTVVRFLKSVAFAKAALAATRIEWQEYSDDVVLNVIYALMPWKGKPGTAAVVQGENAEIQKKAEAEAAHLFESFIKRAAKSPKQAYEYLDAQRQIRDNALDAVRQLIQEASAINQQVIEETNTAILALVRIRNVSDLLVASTGVLAGGFAPVAAGVGYSIVKEWAKGGDADAVGLVIAQEAGKNAAEYSAAKGGTAVQTALVGKHGDTDVSDLYAAIVEKESVMGRYQKELIGKKHRKTQDLKGKIRAKATEIRELEKATSPGRRAIAKVSKYAGHIKWLFFAWEANEAIQEFVSTFDPDVDAASHQWGD